jgi:hypothetical protein
MKWLKQVFAQRYNRREGRLGHIWGDRYWSRIAAEVGEEREASAIGGIGIMGVMRGLGVMMRVLGVRPSNREKTDQTIFPRIFPLPTPPNPG